MLRPCAERASTRGDAGFSLVEALVALAVFALAGVGLIQLQAQSLNTLAQVETRALADIVAQNQIVQTLAGADTALGERSGRTRLANRDWQYEVSIAPTTDARTWRVEVTVRESESERPVARAHAFATAADR